MIKMKVSHVAKGVSIQLYEECLREARSGDDYDKPKNWDLKTLKMVFFQHHNAMLQPSKEHETNMERSYRTTTLHVEAIYKILYEEEEKNRQEAHARLISSGQ